MPAESPPSKKKAPAAAAAAAAASMGDIELSHRSTLQKVPTSDPEHHEDDDWESDPLVVNGGAQKKKARRVKFAAGTYEDNGGRGTSVMGSWLAVIVILGMVAGSMFAYWKYSSHQHHLANIANSVGGSHSNAGGGSRTPSRTRPPRERTPDSYEDDTFYDDNDDDTTKAKDDKNKKKDAGTFYFDPFAAVQTSNPLEMTTESVAEYYGETLVPPVWDPQQDSSSTNNNNNKRLGYMMEPDTVNGRVAFVSEGDLYLAVWKTPTPPLEESSSIPAMKLTTTVGNVRNPKINPVYPYLIAYTATYTARRDVYLLDLRRKTHGSQPAMRLTYWPTSAGVRGLVGWKDDGTTLVFQAYSNEVSLEDVRMYELTLAFFNEEGEGDSDSDTSSTVNITQQQQIQHPQVLQTNPVPLSQALEGAYHDHEDCWYFTRFQQSSNTARYQGGTAESIWSWCEDQELAVSLTTHQFNGTSKAPSILGMPVINKDTQKEEKQHYLLFLSDRGPNEDPNDPNQWKPTTMNLWAVPLPHKDDLDALANPQGKKHDGTVVPSFNPSQFIPLTQISCDFGGMALREYSLDPITQNVVLRIGADLYWMSFESIQKKLEDALPPSRHQKRMLKEGDNETGSEEMTTPSPAQDTTASPPAKTQSKQSSDTGGNSEIHELGILVYSDFHEHQERRISLDFPGDLDSADIYETAFGTLAFLMTARAQVWVAPVVDEMDTPATAYNGAGRNMPARKYRVLPGSKMGGAIRVLRCRHVPLIIEDDTFARRVAVILATDPRSPTAEHAFYLVETHSSAAPTFLSFDDLPEPFVGGHNGGGSVRNGGLGSVMPHSVTVSPCGRRMAWTDTDGRICVMTLPLYKETKSEFGNYTVLPKENELGEPFNGAEAELNWSPGGRYLAVEHSARNQFSILSIVDCGDPLMTGAESVGEDVDPKAAGINITRIVQATPDRFNSYSPFWGSSTFDQNYFGKAATLAKAFNDEPESDVATTTLYFLTDRDIVNKQSSPWGTRAPNPYFERKTLVYGLPLLPQEHLHDTYSGHFSGGGAKELFAERMLDLKSLLKEEEKERSLTNAPSQAPTIGDPEKHFPQDPNIDFGPSGLTFARRAYRLANIPESTYSSILSQAQDDGSMLLLERQEGGFYLQIASFDDFPSDQVEMKEVSTTISDYGLSTSQDHLFFTFSGYMKVIPNTIAGFMSLTMMDPSSATNVVSTEGMAVSVWPSLEYRQMYGDAWRMMRDYFYDVDMTGIDWDQMYDRYLPLLGRCAKREELDDVLVQMASEVSALHVFVYGGEYNTPLLGDPSKSAHVPASFGVAMQRSAEWNGYVITSLPELDPDFSMMDGSELYSPLSNQTLRLSGQQGLEVGDVIVAINGESVIQVPDIHMLLRGMDQQSVRLSVLRLGSSSSDEEMTKNAKPEAVIAVPLAEPDDLLYSAWEWKTRQAAKSLAKDAGFSVGYAHLRAMGSGGDIDSFYRGFFTDFDKDAMIIDVRHNHGGNIDWWLLDVLQRKAWMYWTSRSQNATTGGLGWDEQFSFRGHLVVLIDEKTSSDGEGFSRGVSELGLGRLIGTRTWGGGIWLASDNRLVDGGIATAPEDGTYNEKFGPGLGIEQMGVEPDILVDNNPRPSYDGKDHQLEHAIEVLKDWLEKEPVVVPQAPAHKRNMAYDDSQSCGAKP